jgi:O-methyltransferase
MRSVLSDLAVSVYSKRWFLSRARSANDSRLRRELQKHFRTVDRNVKCFHTEKEMFVMADFLLGLDSPGCIVECGCYRGGSSAKLSRLASATGRKLYVCDSFAGLPDVGMHDGRFDTLDKNAVSFSQGEYAAALADVQNNVKRWGDPSVVEYVPGFFDQTLPELDVRPALIFADADLIDSMRTIIRSLWHRVIPGGRIFMHDMNLVGLVYGVTDGSWWMQAVGCNPPPIFGAGHGCGLGAGGLAYFEKR